jgi:hypothetical protein
MGGGWQWQLVASVAQQQLGFGHFSIWWAVPTQRVPRPVILPVVFVVLEMALIKEMRTMHNRGSP